MLQLRLLGRPVIKYNNEPVTHLNNRKAEALLFYLASTSNPQRRHHVASLLWSDLPEDRGLKNLRYTLWKLRQTLDNVPLKADRLTLKLSLRDAVWVDVVDFRELTGISRGEPLDLQPVANLEKAIELYRGDFLMGFELSAAPFFEDWMQEQRHSFQKIYVNILTKLTQYYSDQRQLDQALTVTRRILEVEPWQEEAHRQLMLLLAKNGQRGAALEHYQHLTHMLASDLDLEPEPETVTLSEQIRTGQISAEKPTVNIITAPDPAIGLEEFEEYAWLLKQWEAALQGIDPAAEGRCLQALGDFAKETTYYQQALKHYEAALINFSQAGETQQAAHSLLNIADTYLITNQYQPALSCLDEAIAYAQAGRHIDLQLRALLALTRTYLFFGNFEAAYPKSEAVVALGNDNQSQLALVQGRGIQAYLHLLKEEIDLARTRLTEALSIASKLEHPEAMANLQQYWGLLHLAEKKPQSALNAFEDGQKVAQKVSQTIELLSFKSRAYLALEQFEQALSCSQQAVAKLTTRNNAIIAAQRVYLNHFHVLTENGQNPAAHTTLETAYQLVTAQSNTISAVNSSSARERFLTNLPWNRDILALYKTTV